MPHARGFVLALAMAVAACAPVRSTPATRYQGMLLSARDLGADALRMATARDAAVRDYVAHAGPPDFVLVASAVDVELVYVGPSRLVHFHQPAPDTASVPSEVTPIPSALLQILPRDLRAGTPRPLNKGTHVACWRVETQTGVCRTCCATRTSCVVDCGQVGSTTLTPRQKAT